MLENFVMSGEGMQKRSSPLIPTVEEAFKKALHMELIGIEVH